MVVVAVTAVVCVLVSLAVMAYFIITAPEGYEDEKGFHYGKPDDESRA